MDKVATDLAARIAAAQARRRSVCKLDWLIRIGEAMLLAPDPERLARKFMLDAAGGRRCMALAEAEERGALVTDAPLTLYEAEIAAGIRDVDGEYLPGFV